MGIDTERITTTLFSLASQIPILLTWLTGIVLAIVFWNRHPKVSLLVSIGLGGLILITLLNTYWSLWLPMDLRNQGVNISQIGMILTIRAVISNLLSAGFWVMILFALFGWRKQLSSPPQIPGAMAH